MGFGGNPQYNINWGYSYPGVQTPGYGGPGAYPVMGGAPPALPAPGGGGMTQGTLVTSSIQNILAYISATIGRRVTVRSAVALLKRMSRVLGAAGAAIALGITLEMAGDLLLADNTRKRRRMNPLNIKALSKAQRRLCSFENRVKKIVSMNRSSIVKKRRRKTCK